ncbi:DUF6250 domain-containing protein [Maribacter forsetii]|uniref:DUF6250 domain-containing protein n=1 Tax=Maribacter forsetii TaxID=444515 RepID=UPI00068AD21C|nr:DUF6250 domain-containing protein [Maribacter forsetii]
MNLRNIPYCKTVILVLFTVLFNYGCAQTSKVLSLNDTLEVRSILLHEENFNDDLSSWQVEQMPGGISEIKNSKLEIDDASGCTIWYKKELSGPIMIEYDTYIISDGGKNDRVSDMNCFWMATDMEHPDDLFKNSAKRHGKFSNYDGLRLYYMGVGGHDNSKTRFRRYVGNGDRPLLDEHDFSKSEFLLQPNTTYHIRIIAYNNVIQYYRNGVKMIDLYDADPYTKGHFGFRTVKNHMTIDNFKVYRLKQ